MGPGPSPAFFRDHASFQNSETSILLVLLATKFVVISLPIAKLMEVMVAPNRHPSSVPWRASDLIRINYNK